MAKQLGQKVFSAKLYIIKELGGTQLLVRCCRNILELYLAVFKLKNVIFCVSVWKLSNVFTQYPAPS